jgi:CheY-like chemotaxis protein
MFSQVDRAMDRSQGGLGIGLTLVKRLVEMHGGTIEASSEGLGKGSTIVVRLPVSREHPDVEKPEPVEQLQKPPRRFLIVDDNVDAAMTLASLLGIAGHATYVAHDGNAALKAFGDHRPDVVLLDIGLPKIDGLEVCRRIRQVPTGHDVTLIALTGWGQDHDRYRSIEAGFDHHLVKPIKLDVLMTLLDDRQDPSAIGS